MLVSQRVLGFTLGLVLARPFLVAAAEPAEIQAQTGRNIYVDPDAGNDRWSGLDPRPSGDDGPVRSIHHAVRRAQPGDTVHLGPRAEPYHESPVFHNAHGEPGRPIVLDGHGATITGCEPLDVAAWKAVRPGVYRCDTLLPAKLLTPDNAVIARFFFRFAGRVQHMGRTMKGKSLPLKAVADLQPGEWTYVADEHAFYVCITPEMSLAEARIEAPVRSNGVQISGDCSHLVIRNLHTRHVYNDGYNIHGKTRNVRFENITATECGDDGFSAHDDCEVSVDGFVARGNSTGIANVNACNSRNERLYFADNLGTDLMFLGSGEHTISNSVVRCTSDFSLRLDRMNHADPAVRCTVRLNNVLVERGGSTTPLSVGRGGVLVADRCSFRGLDFDVRGSVNLERCFVVGPPLPQITLAEGAVWATKGNRYDLRGLTYKRQTYTSDTFSGYQAASQQDQSSVWKPLGDSPPDAPSVDVGVVMDRLPRPPDSSSQP